MTSVLSLGRTSFTYDADGNQTQIESPLGELTTSTWDYENQVTQVENYQGDVVTYTYGIVTQKTDQKRVSKDDGAEEIRYRWDADNIAQETDDVGTVLADYTLQPEAQGDLISQYRDLESNFYHFDGRTNTACLTDSTEVVTNEYVLDAWGVIVSESTVGSAPENEFLFMGQKQVQRDGAFGRRKGVRTLFSPLNLMIYYPNGKTKASRRGGGHLSCFESG